MNEEAYERDQAEEAQNDAEQEALREEACVKYEDFKPLLKEMIDHSIEIGQIDMYEFLIDDKEKIARLLSDGEWQEAIRIIDVYMEG